MADFIDAFPLIRRVGQLRPRTLLSSLEEMRLTIKDTTDKLYEVGLPQILVYAVSCLEAYLKDVYSEINPSDDRQLNFQNVRIIKRVFSAVLKRDVFDGDEKLLSSLNSAFQKRHVIVHRAGIIDRKACED